MTWPRPCWAPCPVMAVAPQNACAAAAAAALQARKPPKYRRQGLAVLLLAPMLLAATMSIASGAASMLGTGCCVAVREGRSSCPV